MHNLYSDKGFSVTLLLLHNGFSIYNIMDNSIFNSKIKKKHNFSAHYEISVYNLNNWSAQIFD